MTPRARADLLSGLALVSGLALAAACADSDRSRSAPGDSVGDSQDGVTERDSAGVRIIENATPRWSREEVWTISAEPILQIGALSGEEPYQFSSIVDAKVLADGSIVLVEGLTREIRVFDPDGTHRLTLGGEGEGPGEFGIPPRIAPGQGDTLLMAWDPRMARLSWFGHDGRLIGDLDRGEAMSGLDPVVRAVPSDWLVRTDGTLLFTSAAVLPGGRMDPGRNQRYLRPALITASGTTPGFPEEVPAGEIVSVEVETDRDLHSGQDRIALGLANPFAPRGSVALPPAPHSLVVVDSAVWEVRFFSEDAILARVVRLGKAREPVTEGMFEAAAAAHAEIGSDEGSRASRQAYPQMTRFDSVPAIAGVRFDGGGNLWIEHRTARGALPSSSSPPERTFEVVDSAGRWLGTVMVPDGVGPLAIGGGRILSLWRDEFDVVYLRVHELRAGGG